MMHNQLRRIDNSNNNFCPFSCGGDVVGISVKTFRQTAARLSSLASLQLSGYLLSNFDLEVIQRTDDFKDQTRNRYYLTHVTIFSPPSTTFLYVTSSSSNERTAEPACTRQRRQFIDLLVREMISILVAEEDEDIKNNISPKFTSNSLLLLCFYIAVEDEVKLAEMMRKMSTLIPPCVKADLLNTCIHSLYLEGVDVLLRNGALLTRPTCSIAVALDRPLPSCCRMFRIYREPLAASQATEILQKIIEHPDWSRFEPEKSLEEAFRECFTDDSAVSQEAVELLIQETSSKLLRRSSLLEDQLSALIWRCSVFFDLALWPSWLLKRGILPLIRAGVRFSDSFVLLRTLATGYHPEIDTEFMGRPGGLLDLIVETSLGLEPNAVYSPSKSNSLAHFVLLAIETALRDDNKMKKQIRARLAARSLQSLARRAILQQLPYGSVTTRRDAIKALCLPTCLEYFLQFQEFEPPN